MKKIVLLVLALFICGAPRSWAEEVQYYTIAPAEGVVMTASADANGMKIVNLKQGTRITFVRQEEDWAKIEVNGRLGWVKNEALKPFKQELLPIYASYYKLLDSTSNLIYAAVSDFTQDGVEDLYVLTDADPSKGQYTETIYSGDTVIYQRNAKDGLTILKNSTDLFLFHHAQKNGEKKVALDDLNDQAKIDYDAASKGKVSFEVATNTYFNTYYIVQSGNQQVAELTLTQEQMASKEFTGGKETNEIGESIYGENYAVSRSGKTTTLSEKEFDELFAHYEKVKGAKIIYSDDGQSASLATDFSYDVARTKKEILELARTVLAEKKQVEQLDGLDTLKVKLAQSLILEVPYNKAIQRNAATYVKNVEKGILDGLPGYDASYFTKRDAEIAQEGMHYFDWAPIDAVIYDFYGVKINTEEFNNLAGGESRSLDSQTYTFPVEEVGEEAKTYPYRQLIQVVSLDGGYDALKFADYEMPEEVHVSESNEQLLLAGEKREEGYVLLKQLPFKSGMKWVYIDTVESIAGLDVTQYNIYENSLALVEQFDAEQEAVPEEQNPIIIEETPKKEQKSPTSQQTSTGWALLLAGCVLFIGVTSASYYLYRKKQDN